MGILPTMLGRNTIVVKALKLESLLHIQNKNLGVFPEWLMV